MTRLRPLFLLALAACAPQSAHDPSCEDGLCDGDRDRGVAGLCEARRADAFASNRDAFTPISVRWACADSPDIENDEKGQEYCESYAFVDFGGATGPKTIGQQEDVFEDFSEPFDPEHLNYSSDDRYFDASFDDDFAQLALLDPEEEVGACLFTSWHSDRFDPIPACSAEEECLDYRGLPLTAQNFRMRNPVNSLEAAANLVTDCLQTFVSPYGFDGQPISDDFSRGCVLNELINRTSYRSSDTNICSAALRLAECGCQPNITEENPRDFGDILGAQDLRGFHLGSWADRKEAPDGCHFVETGDVTPPGAVRMRNLIACPITASEALTHGQQVGGNVDLKTYCDQRFAEEVVVHLFITPGMVSCSPVTDPSEEGYSPFAETCNVDTPWLLEDSAPPEDSEVPEESGDESTN